MNPHYCFVKRIFIYVFYAWELLITLFLPLYQFLTFTFNIILITVAIISLSSLLLLYDAPLLCVLCLVLCYFATVVPFGTAAFALLIFCNHTTNLLNNNKLYMHSAHRPQVHHLLSYTHSWDCDSSVNANEKFEYFRFSCFHHSSQKLNDAFFIHIKPILAHILFQSKISCIRIVLSHFGICMLFGIDLFYKFSHIILS